MLNQQFCISHMNACGSTVCLSVYLAFLWLVLQGALWLSVHLAPDPLNYTEVTWSKAREVLATINDESVELWELSLHLHTILHETKSRLSRGMKGRVGQQMIQNF